MISLSNISHRYQGAPSVHALDGISLNVSQSETLSLVGESGCGKSTILRAIVGLVQPTSGTIEIEGLAPEDARANLACGLLAQSPELFPWRTVGENILLPFELRSARIGRVDMKEALDKARAAATQVGLEGFWDAYPRQLSGGMKARAALARALSCQPTILLLDEPFSSLDEITRRRLNEDLLTLQDETKLTVVLVTHSLREAAFLSDRVAILTPRPGKIHLIVDVPNRDERLSWRETGDFSRFCGKIYGEIEVERSKLNQRSS